MPKDHCAACACLIFLGPCGGHRCYLDDYCCGILYFLTFGFAYVGVLCDCCYLGTMVQAANLKYAGGGGATVVVQNNISNSNSNVVQPQMQSYQPQYAPQHAPQYQQQQPQPQYMTQPQQYSPPPPADWQQGRAKGGFCSSCGASKEGRFCGQCGRE
jgi:hypothetical protein